ncbi:hypothetical protein [Demequina sp. NBRC 110054]|uniref:hypothetical protein n=1 Tax=Demequina sp. NBRC 110054 TaxID=1570343 RepID=UPI000A0206D2|nr:hypothetical protein [Demequina sp. NBRC 110054]
MRWQEILDRFRPVTAPGGAAESAAHVAARTGAALELAPVFAILDADLTAATDLASVAESAAADRLDNARSDAAAVVARARREAPAREAEAAAAILSSAAEDDARTTAQARRDAEQLLASRAPRVDEAAAAVISRLVEDLGGDASWNRMRADLGADSGPGAIPGRRSGAGRDDAGAGS